MADDIEARKRTCVDHLLQSANTYLWDNVYKESMIKERRHTRVSSRSTTYDRGLPLPTA